MRFLLITILCLFFGYALGLVISNNNEISVNLLFYQAPAMNLGLLLIVSIILGLFIGMLLSLLMFKVLQNKWELVRIKKENHKLKGKLDKANAEIEQVKTAINTADDSDSSSVSSSTSSASHSSINTKADANTKSSK